MATNTLTTKQFEAKIQGSRIMQTSNGTWVRVCESCGIYAYGLRFCGERCKRAVEAGK